MENQIEKIIDEWWLENRINSEAGYDGVVIMTRKDMTKLKRLLKSFGKEEDELDKKEIRKNG